MDSSPDPVWSIARRPRLPGRPELRHRRLVAALLALPSALVLGGCHGSPDPTSSAPSPSAAPVPAPVTSAAPAPASPATATPVSGSTTPVASTCPVAAALFALEPDHQATPDARLTATTCSGTWAVIGVQAPGHSQRADLFHAINGTWQPADERQACSTGALPSDIEPGVCDAG